MELNDSCSVALPLRSTTFSLESWAIMTLPTSSPVLPQMSTTLL